MHYLKVLKILACVLCFVIFTGCLGSSKAVHYYTISLTDREKLTEQSISASLFIKKATIEPAYRRNNIVYRESPFDFMFYSYSAWATRPEYLIEQSVYNRIKQAGLFKSVENLDPTVKPDYELLIRVNAIEEIDYENKKQAHLAVVFVLQKTDSSTDLWSKSYDSKREYSGEMREFATAISALLEEYSDDMISEIQKVLKN